jgi:predicted signal transduction protein with EAL and GGDEF domain
VENGKVTSVGVSLGAASYPQSGRTFDQVIVAADKAMYAEKSARKQRRAQEAEPLVEATEVQTVDERHLVHEVSEINVLPDNPDDGFIVELDESHVVSSAIN